MGGRSQLIRLGNVVVTCKGNFRAMRSLAFAAFILPRACIALVARRPATTPCVPLQMLCARSNTIKLIKRRMPSLNNHQTTRSY